MNPTMQVRLLEPDDVPDIIALRQQALLTSPLAFTASPEDDRGLSLEFMRSSLANVASSAVFGAFDDEILVGMLGIVVSEKLKSRHKATIWGMFVIPQARGRGVGTALLQAAIGRARSWSSVVQVQLSVTEAAGEARRLYEQAGFCKWGTQPRALQWEGHFVAEHHLVLDLEVA